MSFQNLIPNDWKQLLKKELESSWFSKLEQIVHQKYETEPVFPPKEKIFRALQLCPVNDVKVIILAQDPYFTPGKADGLAFSCPENNEEDNDEDSFFFDEVTSPKQLPENKKPNIQPSLKNILIQVQKNFSSQKLDPEIERGDLTSWAKSGVLLLNTCLTVRAHSANSHSGLGWQQFTGAIIEHLSKTRKNLVFLLWGRPSHNIVPKIQNPEQHLILCASHPCPLSVSKSGAPVLNKYETVAFDQMMHFVHCNQYLVKHGKERICWATSHIIMDPQTLI